MAASHGNALVFQSGGVTPVINQSLAGVVSAILDSGRVDTVYGAVHGMEGLLAEQFKDLGCLSKRQLSVIARTPGAVLGSARRRLRAEETEKALAILKRMDVRYLFPIGGNDSAETANRLALGAKAAGHDLRIVAVPKTVDNDLPEMDHCPGYGSAARFVALATMGAGRDAESMGEASPVTILEVMGRNAGWLAAAAVLGKREERDAPHVICFPEHVFDEALFVTRMEDAYRRWGFALAVVNENLKGPGGPLGHQGEPLYVDDFGHPYFQSPAQYLAVRLSKHLRVRVRAEKPGTIQRSLVPCISSADAAEARMAGEAAVRAALAGQTDVMVTLMRAEGPAYRCYTGVARLEAIAAKERLLPPEYMDGATALPTQAFIHYARPLIGPPLPRFGRV